MSLHILTPGIQTTLQSAPREGLRHMGMPWAGPADPLSFALAQRLVGNPASAPALEISYGGFEARFEADAVIALTGAPAPAKLGGAPAAHHETLRVRAGQPLALSPPQHGARTYLAMRGGFEAEEILGSGATYVPAGLGGHHGRALQAGDVIGCAALRGAPDQLSTPPALRPHIASSWALRLSPSAESDQLDPASEHDLYAATFTVSPQSNRMGVRLSGPALQTTSAGKMKSAATFPGTLQCPEDGQPILLLADGGTTGGYPRIGHVAACDRHMLGQLRPGDNVRFIARSFDAAIADHKAKSDLFRDWLA